MVGVFVGRFVVNVYVDKLYHIRQAVADKGGDGSEGIGAAGGLAVVAVDIVEAAGDKKREGLVEHVALIVSVDIGKYLFFHTLVGLRKA